MSESSPGRLTSIADAVMQALPGWRLVGGPEPFGWAPRRHLRARLERGAERQQVVLRQSWTEAGHRREALLYQSVLPHLGLVTARLLATFELAEGGPPWSVLEDLGTCHVVPTDAGDRAALLEALGALHAESRKVLRDRPEVAAALARFAASSPLHQRWQALVERAGANPDTGIEPWHGRFLSQTLQRLDEEEVTLVHGDLDLTNTLLTARGLALIDWEQACIGPPSLDLGAVVEVLESREELESYQAAFCAAGGRALTDEQVQQWRDLGDAYDCFRWICYHLGEREAARDPGEQWREAYYYPRLRRLRSLA